MHSLATRSKPWTPLLLVVAAFGLGAGPPAWGWPRPQDNEGGEQITLLHPDGSKAREGLIQNGRRVGLWTAWHPSGELAYRGTFKEDRKSVV